MNYITRVQIPADLGASVNHLALPLSRASRSR
jgi:hypothetical protein